MRFGLLGNPVYFWIIVRIPQLTLGFGFEFVFFFTFFSQFFLTLFVSVVGCCQGYSLFRCNPTVSACLRARPRIHHNHDPADCNMAKMHYNGKFVWNDCCRSSNRSSAVSKPVEKRTNVPDFKWAGQACRMAPMS